MKNHTFSLLARHRSTGQQITSFAEDANGDNFELLYEGVQEDKWYYTTATFNDATGLLKLFVNGNSVQLPLKVKYPIARQTLPVRIGLNVEPTSNQACFFDGIIDEVRISSRELEPVRIYLDYLTQKEDADFIRCGLPKGSPTITRQPVAQNVIINGTGKLSIGATGSEPLEYQWYKNGEILSGENAPSILFDQICFDDLGIYSCKVNNYWGEVESEEVTVSTISNENYIDLQPIAVEINASVTTEQVSFLRDSGYITVLNSGTADMKNGLFTVTCFEDINRNNTLEPGTDNILGNRRIETTIYRSGSKRIPVLLEGYLSFAGTPIFAMVDAENEIDEFDEENNIKSNKTECSVEPLTGSFDPHLEWQWRQSAIVPLSYQVYSAPVVGNLTDDNGDGVINNDDVPEIIFITFYDTERYVNGVLRAVSGKDGTEQFSITDYNFNAASCPALGDIDGDGIIEILVIEEHSVSTQSTRVLAFENDGTFKWASPQLTFASLSNGAMLAIADIDHDENPEIILGHIVLHNDGTVKWTGTTSSRGYSVPVDLDMSGAMEILSGNTAYRSDGTVFWQNAALDENTHFATGNFDNDVSPEIVCVSLGLLFMLEHDGTVKWGPVDIPPAGTADDWGGPPTIADVDNDGIPEIGVASSDRYVVFEADGSVKWTSEVSDYSSAQTGSSVFDFENDGRVEIVYADEEYIRIFNGRNGDVLFQSPQGSGTYLELPVVADVDNDNNAEIVVVSNDFPASWRPPSQNHGIQVYGDLSDNWVNTRKIWNQHTYHLTNSTWLK